MKLRLSTALWSMAAACLAQSPSFQADRVLAGDHSIPLAPGLLVSIYGNDLGPTIGCEGHADQQRRETPSALRPSQSFVETLIYPKHLCDTQVLVGGIPAGLLYVAAKQINFKVPQQIPISGTADLQVIYKGRPSRPIKLPLGLESVTLSLESPATVGMPVWLKVSAPSFDRLIRYPLQIWPASFGCHEIEVRKKGRLLTPFATRETQAFRGVFLSGLGPCGMLGLPAESHHLGRLPLHLRYRFDRPGTYEVRYTLRYDFPENAPPLATSAWTPFTIQAAVPGERGRWLTNLQRDAPSGTVELMTDFLPRILGTPDQQSLELLLAYLYHPDNLVRQFAMYGLTYWPKDVARKSVRATARTRGVSDVVAEFLHRDGDTLIEIAIPGLKSDSPVILRGAVTAISHADSSIPADLRKRAEIALIDAVEHIVVIADNQTKSDYASALGTVRDERARSILWSFVDRKIALAQSLIALTWIHAPADLSRLAQIALVPAKGDSLNYDVASLPYAIHRGYGDASLPYLETMLKESEFTWVRTNAARELVIAGRPTGFSFMADAIENNRRYRGEMIQFLRDRFPDLRKADDTTILAFAKGRR